MPTANPRIGVVVTPEQHQLLMDLGKLQGRSAASYLNQALDAAEPMLRALLPILRQTAETVAQQPLELQQAIRAALAEVDAKTAQLSLLEHLARVQPDLANDQGPSGADAPSGARADGTTRKRSRRA